MSDKNRLGSQINGGNTAYERKESDFYPTPPNATIALLEHLKISKGKTIWEPACGEGHMVTVIRNAGYNCLASDIDEMCKGFVWDFLNPDDCYLSRKADWIITNPPFSKSEEFIRRAAQLEIPFAYLLKSQYWHARRRLELFREITPYAILPLTWRPDFMFGTRGGGSPLMDVSWVVWNPFQSILPYGKRSALYIPLKKPNEDTLND